jgi:heat shock protein HslJ
MKPAGPILLLSALAVSFIGCSRSEKTPPAEDRPGSPQTPATPTAPASLFGRSWLVQAIGDRGALDNAHPSVRFDAEGRATGTTGLNNFTGTAVISGESIRIGPLAATRRAGPEALMDQEHQFLTALESAATWWIDDAGLLGLRNAAGDTLMRLSPVPNGAPDQPGAPTSGK